jgi:hypothetical protein
MTPVDPNEVLHGGAYGAAATYAYSATAVQCPLLHNPILSRRHSVDRYDPTSSQQFVPTATSGVYADTRNIERPKHNPRKSDYIRDIIIGMNELGEGSCAHARIDTGADAFFISLSKLKQRGARNGISYEKMLEKYRGPIFHVANRTKMPILGQIMLTWRFRTGQTTWTDLFLVVEELLYDAVLGGSELLDRGIIKIDDSS